MGRVTSVAKSVDGAIVVSGSDDFTVRLWGSQYSKWLQVQQGHNDNITSVASGVNHIIIASASDDNNIHTWDTKSSKLFQTLHGHIGSVTSIYEQN